ncbi:MAG: hypothetical protein HYS78_02050 [Parcubacteria group bacterium]|nr:hypothetical protein [Parcubacteria group bacterium]
MVKYVRYGYHDVLAERRKRRKIRVVFLVGFSLFFLVSFSTYALFFSGWFTLKEIQVSGNREIKEEEVKNLISAYTERTYFGYIKPFSNILFSSSETLERSLSEKFKVIDRVDVNKNFFRKYLSVELDEKEAAGTWCKEDSDKCFFFDGNGALFKAAPKFSGEAFLAVEDGRGRDFNLGDSFDDKELLEKINLTRNILDELKVVGYSGFFLAPGSFEFWVKTKEGWNIYLDKANDIPTQLVALKKFLDEKLPASRRRTIEYVDLKINNRIYYK